MFGLGTYVRTSAVNSIRQTVLNSVLRIIPTSIQQEYVGLKQERAAACTLHTLFSYTRYTRTRTYPGIIRVKRAAKISLYYAVCTESSTSCHTAENVYNTSRPLPHTAPVPHRAAARVLLQHQ